MTEIEGILNFLSYCKELANDRVQGVSFNIEQDHNYVSTLVLRYFNEKFNTTSHLAAKESSILNLLWSIDYHSSLNEYVLMFDRLL